MAQSSSIWSRVARLALVIQAAVLTTLALLWFIVWSDQNHAREEALVARLAVDEQRQRVDQLNKEQHDVRTELMAQRTQAEQERARAEERKQAEQERVRIEQQLARAERQLARAEHQRKDAQEPVRPQPMDTVPPDDMRSHYDLAESLRLKASNEAQFIENLRCQPDETIARAGIHVDKLFEAKAEAEARYKDAMQKAEAEYHWVQDHLARVPAPERFLTPDGQANVAFVRANCLFNMEKFAEAQDVYEEQARIYAQRIQEGNDNKAARRRLDAKGCVLRCLTVQGRMEEAQTLATEIRGLLVDMDDSLRAEWETWMKLSVDANR